MEGPYRDLGSGFARLAGAEGARRAPSRIACVEDALFELLRNSRDAGARNVYVASTLSRRRYRTLTVIDDGAGIPDRYVDLVFEPGVTTRHLEPRPEPASPADAPPIAPHGAGMSLYHVRRAAQSAAVVSPANPTSIKTTFDTRFLQERSLQSGSRPSRSNLQATLQNFLQHHTNRQGQPAGYYGSPARILATILQDRIIQIRTQSEVREAARSLGLGVSEKTLTRVRRGEVPALQNIGSQKEDAEEGEEGSGRARAAAPVGGMRVFLRREELSGIAAILRDAARSSYMEIGKVEVNSRPGEIVLKARVYEPEDEYE